MTEKSAFFSSLIERGQFRVDEEGHARLFGEFVLFIPPKVILKLQQDLESMIGQEESHDFVANLGAYQVRQGMERYKEKYGWDNISKDDLLDYIQNIAKLMGWGDINVESLDVEEKEYTISVSRATFPEVYRREHDEPANEPVCHYLRGMMEQAMSALLGKDIEAVEERCAAVDGDKCVFRGN